MHFSPSKNGFSLRESRLCFRQAESNFGDHMKDYGRDLRTTYFSGKKDLVGQTLGVVAAAANVVLKGPDEVVKGVLKQPYNAPHGIAGHTIADTKSLISNVLHLRPLRALGDASSLVFSDIPMDAVNLLTGNNLHNTHRSVRAAAGKTLAA